MSYVCQPRELLDSPKLPQCLGTGLGQQRTQWFCCVSADLNWLHALSMHFPSLGKPPRLLMLCKVRFHDSSQQHSLLFQRARLSVVVRTGNLYSQTCYSSSYSMYPYPSPLSPGEVRPWVLLLDVGETITLIRSSDLFVWRKKDRKNYMKNIYGLSNNDELRIEPSK